MAVQDFDGHVLEAVKRDICGNRGIPTFNELILGLPGQTYQSFARTIATAMPALPRHDFVLFLCRLIDNTELGDPESRERFGIQTRRCQWKTSTAVWDPIIDEYQEVVVGTNDMPIADWRRTYRLSYFASALYNLRLLRVVLQHVVDVTGSPLEAYLTQLTDSMDEAEPGTVYAELRGIFERYTDSLLSGGPFVLPFDGEGPIVVDEAAARVALRRYDEFLRETRQITGTNIETINEAFRYQSLITPRWGEAAAVEESFAHDWAGYTAGGGLKPDPSRVRFTPGSAVASPTFHGFAGNHLACIRARLDVGRVEVVRQAEAFVILAGAG